MSNEKQSQSGLLLWNVKQAAEALGLSVHTLYSWVSQGNRIPFVKLGNRTMFDPVDLQKWINDHKTQQGGT
ncbi:MAG: helix-turn-helix domain-containing protein [Desulfocucumaceae bacterium]